MEVVARPEFSAHDRVAINYLSMSRDIEDLFIPLYMGAFPNQTLVERRDVKAVMTEQDLLPERLNEETRAKLRKILGVKAIVYPSFTSESFGMKVIDTNTGAITASVFVDSRNKWSEQIPAKDLVRIAITALKEEALKNPAPPPTATAENPIGTPRD